MKKVVPDDFEFLMFCGYGFIEFGSCIISPIDFFDIFLDIL